MTGREGPSAAVGCLYVVGILAVLLALGVVAWWLVSTFSGVLQGAATGLAVAR